MFQNCEDWKCERTKVGASFCFVFPSFFPFWSFHLIKDTYIVNFMILGGVQANLNR